MNIMECSYFKIHFYNTMATAIDYKNLQIYANLEVGPMAPLWDGTPLNTFNRERELYLYAATPAGRGGMAQLSPHDVFDMLATPLQRDVYAIICGANVGQRAWTVTALGTWILALSDETLRHLLNCKWFHLPIHLWIKYLGESGKWLAIKRTGTVRPYPASTTNELNKGLDTEYTLFSKLANITYREKDPCNWQSELHRRCVDTPVHYFPTEDGLVDREKWNQKLFGWIKRFAETAVPLMAQELRLEDFDTWWASRYAWAPAGSSSKHKLAENVVRQETTEADKGGRANKKAVASILPDDHARQVLSGQPKLIGRASTKFEPGGKQRALYAQDDDSFFIAAYASVAIERSINIEGIYAQQAPSDVAEWVRKHAMYARSPCCFLSLDYSDFNTEHEQAALFTLNMVMADAWRRLGPPVVGKHKAAAAIWTALAHLNAWVTVPKMPPTRIFATLMSGHRDTARDNCILHAAYSAVCLEAAKQWDSELIMHSKMYTGDDEDSIMNDWVSAFHYLAAHHMAGFVLKPSKQLTGTHECPTHEYLQRTLDARNMPQRPLAAALAQLLSGNWYNQNMVWFDGMIPSVNATCWELHLRGMPIAACRLMAARILDRTMSVYDEESADDSHWKYLEWWRYRSCGTYSPLWDCTSDEPPKVPNGDDAIIPVSHAPGVAAWVAKQKANLGRLMKTSDERQYDHLCRRKAVSCLYKARRNRDMHHAARRMWGERPRPYTVIQQEELYRPAPVPQFMPDWILHWLGTTEIVRTPNTESELAGRLGLDPDLVAQLGGIAKVYRHLRPADQARFANVTTAHTPPRWALAMDPAIIAWISSNAQVASYNPNVRSWAQTARSQIAQRLPSKSSGGITLVVAGNGTGKTTFAQSETQYVVVEAEDLLRRVGYIQLSRTTSTFAHLQLTDEMLQQLEACMTHNGMPDVVLTQFPIKLTYQLLHALYLHPWQIVMLEIPEQSMMKVMTDERLWSTQRAIRRIDRLQNIMLQYAAEAQRDNIPAHKVQSWAEVRQMAGLSAM
jgi:hypothetical protein